MPDLNEDIRHINNARDILVGKVTNPISQVDLITVALIYKFMDDMDLDGLELSGQRTFFVGDYEKYAFSKIMDTRLGAQDRMNLFDEALNKLQFAEHLPPLFRRIFKETSLPFKDPRILTLFLKEIEYFSYHNSETLGHAFEYLLNAMGSQGNAGQFRTPRHIIDFIVDVVNPDKDDTILDPACGTSGFLISAYKHIMDKYAKNSLTPTQHRKLTENICGYDNDPTMAKLATVNMYLHRFNQPKIFEYDTLSDDTRWNENFDVVLANPPFMTPKGGIVPHNKFRVRANKAEVLFVDYIAEHLNLSGKAGIIVPEGIIFQTANAYKQLRQMLIEDNLLYAVVSLPAGVFKPYSGVKTSILLLDRQLAKKSKDILFVRVDNDGFELGDQRKPISANDLPEALEIIEKWKAGKDISKHDRAMIVSKEKLAESDYNLTAGRYQEGNSFEDCKYEIVKLGDKNYFTVESGGTPSTTNPEYWNGDIPWISLVDVPADNRITEITNTERTITETGLKNSSAKILPVDSVVVSSRATIGRVGITKIPLATNQGFKNIIIKDQSKVNPVYLANAVTQLAEQMEDLASGGTFKEISKTNFETLEIPLPPIEVQKQIVEEIENKQTIINNTRQTLRNLERERFYTASLLEGIDYELVALGDICETTSGGTPLTSKNEYYENGTIPWIGSGELNQGIINTPKNFITELGLRNSSAKLVPVNSVLIAMYGATTGQVGLLKFEAATNQAVCSILPNDKIVPEFLYHLLSSQKQNLVALSAGGAQQNISQKIIKEYKIPLPSIEDQERIVVALDSELKASESAKQLIDLMQNKIDNVIHRIYKTEI